ADCHMPYLRTGALKISDHWVRSPVLNLSNAWQTCHRWSEGELRNRVFTIQDRTYQLRNVAIDAVLDLARGIARAGGGPAANAANAAGAADGTDATRAEDPRLAAARTYQRWAQFLTDCIEAENSMGFHADQEAMRVLGLAINYARLGAAALHAEGPPPAPALLPPPPQIVIPPEEGEIFRHRTVPPERGGARELPG
ncbi:MAG: ammonia-forming cytochrome c nitrite reductase subunit c552, partial [Candidatus Krumholzibacteriia bacterium]